MVEISVQVCGKEVTEHFGDFKFRGQGQKTTGVTDHMARSVVNSGLKVLGGPSEGLLEDLWQCLWGGVWR